MASARESVGGGGEPSSISIGAAEVEADSDPEFSHAFQEYEVIQQAAEASRRRGREPMEVRAVFVSHEPEERGNYCRLTSSQIVPILFRSSHRSSSSLFVNWPLCPVCHKVMQGVRLPWEEDHPDNEYVITKLATTGPILIEHAPKTSESQSKRRHTWDAVDDAPVPPNGS